MITNLNLSLFPAIFSQVNCKTFTYSWLTLSIQYMALHCTTTLEDQLPLTVPLPHHSRLTLPSPPLLDFANFFLTGLLS